MLNFGALKRGNALEGLGDSGMSLTLMVSKPSLQGLSNIFIKSQESRRAAHSGPPFYFGEISILTYPVAVPTNASIWSG